MANIENSIDEANRLVEERLKRSSLRADSHERVETIENRLQIEPLEKLLLTLAKADVWALELCTDTSRKNLVGLGLIVLFTGTIAFFTSWYTFTSMIFPRDANSSIAVSSVIFGGLLAAIYAMGIMIIDREIVSSINSKPLMIAGRFIFAVIVSLAVSYPVKLLFFDGAIQNEIREMIRDKRKNDLDRASGLEAKWEKEIATKESDLQKQVEKVELSIKRADYNADLESEPKRGGCRDLCKGFQKEKAEHQKRLEELIKEKGNLRLMFPLPEPDKREIEQIKKATEEAVRNSQDLMTKWQASDRIKRDSEKSGDTSYGVITGFVIAFFFFLEMMPVLIKFSLGKSEYQYYLEARQNINSQKIVSITNFYMQAMQDMDAPLNVLKVPAEVTEWMHASMEDERVPYRASGERSASSEPRSEKVAREKASPSSGSAEAAEHAENPDGVPVTPVTVPPRDETTDEPRS
jgi:hypothetical protein